MKYPLFTLTIATFLVSCTPVRFNQPQPEGVKSLTQFPDDLTGFYVDEDGDTLWVNSEGFEYGFGNPDSDCLKRALSSPKMVLKNFRKSFVLSLKEEEQWDVFLIEPDGEGFDLRLIDISSREPEKLELLEEITKVEVVKNDQGEISYFLVRPTRHQFRRILKAGLFDENQYFKKVDRVMP